MYNDTLTKDLAVIAKQIMSTSSTETLDEDFNLIGQFKTKKTKTTVDDEPDGDTLEEYEYDIVRSGKKVGEMQELGVGTIYGKLHGKNLPELSSYKGKNPGQKLQSFLKSKTGARWAKNVKELSDIFEESVNEESLNENTKLDKVLDLLINAIGKNASKPEFQKASQAYEDWGNAFGGSRKKLLGRGPQAFWMDIEEVLDIRVESVNEEKGDKEAYQKFFNDTLKKYGAKSPSELKGDDEKKFYDEIDAGWEADDEKKESVELEEAKVDLTKKVKNTKEFESYMDAFKGQDILTALEELDSGKKPAKGTVGFFLSQQMSMKEGTTGLDGRRKEFREKIKKLAYAKAKEMVEDEEELEEGVFSNFIKHSIRKFMYKLSPDGKAASAEKAAAAQEKLLLDYERIKSAQERIKAANAAIAQLSKVISDKAHLTRVEKQLQVGFKEIDAELDESVDKKKLKNVHE
tara:strand:- start:439 stop:1821 length:1383 start_codon:yes stop_codon:yes gene_type:complete